MTKSTFEHLLVGHDGDVVVVKMARAKAKNALNQGMLKELRALLAKVSADPQARALLLTGEGDVFCAGADLKERRENPGQDAKFRAPLLAFWDEVAAFSKPFIVAVNGHAAGGGFELTLLADAVIASQDAQFWLPEVQWGGIPGGWGTQMLTRLVGPLRARWIILNGHRLSAPQMLEMGLVTHVTPQDHVLDTARAIAKELATRPPTAVAMAKEAIRQAMNLPLSQGVIKEEALLQISVASPERQAMLDRFAEGHRPK
ncbi:MAG: enoyl-CoA hydratase/isomerase family protein [Betaproteobacteria bacterium]|jgi:enoyl-CoA hydratase